MSEYKLNEGRNTQGDFLGNVSEKARDAAIRSAGDASSLLSDKTPVVLKKNDEGHTVEFFGYKDFGDFQPMTVTGVVINGQEVKFDQPVRVDFIQPRHGEGIIEGTWNNFTNAPNHKDTGKLTKASSDTLDNKYKTIVVAKEPEKSEAQPILVKPAPGAPFIDVSEQSGPGEGVGKSNPNPVETGRGAGS